MALPHRLSRLPSRELPAGVVVVTAATPRSRLLGLAWLPTLDRDHALLLPRCRSVHTFGMRFPLDLVWVGADGLALRMDAGVEAGHVRGCRRSYAVIETAAGAGERVAAAVAAAGGVPPG